MHDYSQYDDGPSEGELGQLTDLVEELAAKERRVEEIEQNLKDAKSEVRTLAESRIPQLMASIGVETITTKSGLVVSIQKTYRASPLAARREEAWQWLEEHGHGGLLKRSLSVAFTKGEEERAAALRAELEREHVVKEDRGVHPSTLKAWAKEMIEAGKAPPMELFGIEIIESAKVKRPT